MKEKGYCRCCLSENCNKDMINEYLFNGTREIYSTMLTDTLNINISDVEDRCLICEGCIARLREAAAFKIQVLATEQTFIKIKTIINGIDSKTQLKMEDDFDDKVSDCSDSVFAWGSETKDTDEQFFAIKMNDNKRNNIKTTQHLKSDDTCSIITNKSTNKVTDKTKNITKTQIIKLKKVTTKIKVKSNKEKVSVPKTTKLSEYDIDRRKNTLKLLLNSNMCMFNSHRVKFGCYACKTTYTSITYLREHVKIHSNIKHITSKINQLRGLSYKNVDITDLKCHKCDARCENLVDLQNHLIVTHKIDFVSRDHFLIPYRLENELRCVICDQSFNTFTRLSIHMNSHYTNNVCDVCGLSFINRPSLRMHHLAQHREKKCKICGAIFFKSSENKTHMELVHQIKKKYNTSLRTVQ